MHHYGARIPAICDIRRKRTAATTFTWMQYQNRMCRGFEAGDRIRRVAPGTKSLRYMLFLHDSGRRFMNPARSIPIGNTAVNCASGPLISLMHSITSTQDLDPGVVGARYCRFCAHPGSMHLAQLFVFDRSLTFTTHPRDCMAHIDMQDSVYHSAPYLQAPRAATHRSPQRYRSYRMFQRASSACLERLKPQCRALDSCASAHGMPESAERCIQPDAARVGARGCRRHAHASTPPCCTSAPALYALSRTLKAGIRCTIGPGQ